MNVAKGIFIFTVLVVFFIYYAYNYRKQHYKNEEGYIDSYFAESAFHDTKQRKDSEIMKKKDDIKDKENDLIVLLEQLKHVREKIVIKEEELKKLRSDQNKLNIDFKILLDNMDTLQTTISTFVNNDEKPFVGTLNVFDLQAVRNKKDAMNEEITSIKQIITNDLIHYDDTDISTVTKIQDEQTGLIHELEEIKTIYSRMYEILKKNTSFMEVCSGDVLDNPKYPEYVKDYITNEFDRNEICTAAAAENINLESVDNDFESQIETNFNLGRSICESKKGTCIYETSNIFPKSYERGTYSYIFHEDKWPLENSCEAQTLNCFSLDTLGEDACKGVEIPLWFIKTDEPGEYYSSNVGYVPLELEGGNEWVCEIDLEKSKQIHNRDRAEELTRGNCLEQNRGYGKKAYDCWTVTDGDINVSHNKNDEQSKKWTNDINTDGSFGQCEINTTCKTKIDALNHVNCLNEDFSSTGNFQCWEMMTDNTINPTNTYRNTYTPGEWNSNENIKEHGYCSTKVKTDCRTKYDVEAEAQCLTTDNWVCGRFNFQPHASNIGFVEVDGGGGQFNKVYAPLDYSQIDNDNRGAGTCETRTGCMNPEVLQMEADCHNTNNHRCWEVNTDYSASQTNSGMYNTFDDDNVVCISNETCLTKAIALLNAEEACHASEMNRCYSIDNSITNDDGSIGFKLADDTDGYTQGRLTKFTEESETRSICERRTCPSKETLCQSLSVSCYLDNPQNNIKTNNEGLHNRGTEHMVYDETLDKCVIPETCKQIPYCSYSNVLTGSSSFDITDVNGLDCSAGDAYGVKHRWMLESSTQESIDNPTDHLNDLSKWSFIGDGETSLCIRDPNIPVTSTAPPVSDTTNEFTCECTDSNYSSEMRYFINDDLSDNTGLGVETVEGICGPNDCGERSYHQAKVRLVSCYGDKHKDVTSNVGTFNCVNPDACRRKCLNNGFIDGEPVVVPETDIPITCFAPATNEEINKFTYEMGTCSSNDCSDTQYGSCLYQDLGANAGWGTGEIVPGTDNKESTLNHNPDEEIFELGTGLSQSGHLINYDTRTDGQVGCPDSSDHTIPDNRYMKKSVYKYARTVSQVDDGICIPVPDKIQVKYTIENEADPCPKDCVYYWETDGSGTPVWGDCSSTCRDTSATIVTQTQNYLIREGNSVGNSTCPTPSQSELDSHTQNCTGLPLCCTPNAGTWGNYMHNGTDYGSAGDCPSCTNDGNSITLTRTTSGKVTCDPATGIADTTTQDENMKICNPNRCGDEVPGTSGYSGCSESQGASCTLNGSSFTKPGTRTRNYKVYSVNGQDDRTDNPEACSINCTNPSPPNGLNFTGKTPNSITIAWNAGNNGDTTVTGYDILFNNTKHNSTLVTTNTYTLNGLLPSSHYQIKVQKRTTPPFDNLFSNQIEVVTDQRNCGPNEYTSGFTHNGSVYASLAEVPCASANCGSMNVTKVYSPNNCNGSKANETVTKNCGYCVSTTGGNKFFHILFHDTNDVIDTGSISDWTGTLKSQFRFLVSGDVASYQMHVGKTPNEMETLPQYHKEFVTFELARCNQCNRDKVLQVILTKDTGSVKSHSNGNLYLHGGGNKLAYYQDRVITPYSGVMYIEHELERVGGFGDNSHKSAIYYIKELTGSTYASVNRSNRNAGESSLSWVSNKVNATQFVITNNGLLLREGYWDGTNRGNQRKTSNNNSWRKMTKHLG